MHLIGMGYPIESSDAPSRLMQRLYLRVGERWSVAPLKVLDVYRHYEDDDFGFPPMYISTQFSLAMPPLKLWVDHQRWLERGEANFVELTFLPYNEREKWHIVAQKTTREELARMGFSVWSPCTARLNDADDDNVVVDAVLDKLSCLSLMQFELVRASDLPPTIEWPPSWLRDAFTRADRVTRIGDHEFSVEDEFTSTVRVTDADLPFVEWWLAR